MTVVSEESLANELEDQTDEAIDGQSVNDEENVDETVEEEEINPELQEVKIEEKPEKRPPIKIEKGVNYFVALKGVPSFFYPVMKFKMVGTDTFWEMLDQRTGKYTRGIFQPPVIYVDPKEEEAKVEELRGRIRKDPKIIQEKKEESDELEQLKYEANLTIVRLAEICRDGWELIKTKRTPTYTGDYEKDYAVDETIRYFVEKGVYDFAEQIVTLIEGLVKYARYSNDIFGDDNINLKVVLRSYKTIANEVKFALGDAAVNKLHDLITCAEVVISVQPEAEYAPIVEPAILSSSSAKEHEEESGE